MMEKRGVKKIESKLTINSAPKMPAAAKPIAKVPQKRKKKNKKE
jgi:hypothetical protein